MKREAPNQRTGTQSIERAVLVLRELANRGAAGWGLGDLASRCQLDRGTTHRIVAALVRERLVQQRASDRRYFVGPLIFELSVTQTWYTDFQQAARTAVRRLARQLPSTVALLYLRSHDDCVCIAREGTSSYTREGTGIRIGQRAPLLSLAGGAAILCALPSAELSEVVERNAERLAHLGRTRLGKMKQLVRASVGKGYVFGESVFWEGVSSVAMAIVSDHGTVIGAIVLSRAAQDLPPDRVEMLLAALAPAIDGMVKASHSIGQRSASAG